MKVWLLVALCILSVLSGNAYPPDSVKVDYVSKDGDNKLVVTWVGHGGSNGSDCDADLTYESTVFSHQIDGQYREFVMKAHSGNFTIPPDDAPKCAGYEKFDAKTICKMANGTLVNSTNTTTSNSHQVFIPLHKPKNATTGAAVCDESDIISNCTFTLVIPPYDCGCPGELKSVSYEVHDDCIPVSASMNSYTWNCSDFTTSLSYRAICQWNDVDQQVITLSTYWSDEFYFNFTAANQTLTRAPVPLPVLIVVGAIVVITAAITLFVVIRRASGSGGYESVR